MDLGVGITSVDHRAVVKDYSEIFRFENVVLKDDTSVQSPVFLLDFGSMDISELSDINYVHWFKMKRFYYIIDKVFNGQCVELHCQLDARRTWMETIRNSTQFVNRQERTFNKQLFDAEIPIESMKKQTMYVFPNAVGDSTPESRNYVLVTNGKKEGD